MSAPIVIREAVVRYRGGRRRVSGALRNPVDVARFVRQLVRNDAREHFVTLMLDARHQPIAYQVVSIGTATASLVHPREVFQAAVGVGACAVIVAHNHPSGNPTPSREDLEVTRRLIQAGEVIGIRLIDSVVAGDPGYVSIRETNPEIFEGGTTTA